MIRSFIAGVCRVEPQLRFPQLAPGLQCVKELSTLKGHPRQRLAGAGVNTVDESRKNHVTNRVSWDFDVIVGRVDSERLAEISEKAAELFSARSEERAEKEWAGRLLGA